MLRTSLASRSQFAVPAFQVYTGLGVQAANATCDSARNMSTLPANFNKIGTGGRSSVSGITATVFGSTGFLGRYVITEIGRIGSQVVMPTRCTDNHRQHLKVMGDLGQMIFMDYDPLDKDAIMKSISQSNVVINMIGRDFETYNWRYKGVHVDIPKLIAECAAEAGIPQLIHVSALGASTSNPSEFFQSKAEGEAAVREAFPDATIVRPAHMVGVEDRLMNDLARHIINAPFGLTPLVDGGYNKLQPVNVHDVGLAIAEMVKDPSTIGKTYELAGPKVYSMKELHALAALCVREIPRPVFVPSPVAPLMGLPREILQKKIIPFALPNKNIFEINFLKSMTEDYTLNRNPTVSTFKDLHIVPRQLEGLNVDYLRSYRSGGYDYGSTAQEQNAKSRA
eukprot:CAMPEP_0197847278 /NCGR_PEP_ID=MMETSP1438-20131217/5685_1 /TAXON_ID=1461541 /ORGANISM="Pterosperma sp., Strain CCMP1384" /LENGTH=394 /DNA_ID=CAMNT_0043459153 /DNA_START=66 /DNA_END=1250 /DNA_ORIENTATION=+